MENEMELQRQWGLMQKGQFGAAMGIVQCLDEELGPAFKFRSSLSGIPVVAESAHVDVVFVRTPEEAETFPDNVLVGFPTEQTEASLRAMNFYTEMKIAEEGLVLPEGLELPLTMDDLIDRQDAMHELFRALGPAQSGIRRGLPEESTHPIPTLQPQQSTPDEE